MNKKGFTIVELTAVLIMTSIVTVITISRGQSARVRANEAGTQMNMHALQLAAEDFATMAEGRYPENLTDQVDDVLEAIGLIVSNDYVLADAEPATGATVNDGNNANGIALLPGNNTYANPFIMPANSIDNDGTQFTIEAQCTSPPCHVDNPGADGSGEGTVYWAPVGTAGCGAMIGYVIFGDGDKQLLSFVLTSDN
jgi:type II secretory pathway pseudopilin PulG